MQQNRLQNFPTKAERENSNDGLQTGSASATKTEAENQDGGLQTGIEITYIFATLHDATKFKWSYTSFQGRAKTVNYSVACLKCRFMRNEIWRFVAFG